MSSFRMDRFLRPSFLQSIEPSRLSQFLIPYSAYLETRGFKLAESDLILPAQIERLVGILCTPNREMPHPLMDAIHLVCEMANPRCMEEILRRIPFRELGFSKDEQFTPADVAVQAWMSHQFIIEGIHAEQIMLRARSFESFQSVSEDPPTMMDLTTDEHQSLELELSEWFRDKSCGKGCKVFVFPQDESVHLLIRHGDPMRREEFLEENEVGSVFYRPLKYDVLIFNQTIGELKINADSVSQKVIYCKLIGKHFFGDEDLFPPSSRYSLEPLAIYGPTALSCSDVEQMISATLVELQILIGGTQKEILVHKAKDVFEALEERKATLPTEPKFLRCKLQVRFSDSKRPRSVTICPPNVAIFTRDSDADRLEGWMQNRGFIVEGSAPKHDKPKRILASD